jgi:hypothetical protein
MKYYQFLNGWVKEEVIRGQLTRSLYTADPRTDARAVLDNITEFDAETEAEARRMRQGFVMGDGRTEWHAWEPV